MAAPTPAIESQDRIAGRIYHALAIRQWLRFRNARNDAIAGGVDPSALALTQEVDPNVLCERYQELLDEWLPEEANSAGVARASMALAAEIVAETLLEDFTAGGPVGSYRDSCHLLKLLQNVDGFLIGVENREAFVKLDRKVP